MKAQTAFAAAFIAALFLPPLLLDRTSVVSQKENRNLAQKPAIIADGGMNREYFSQLDAWLGDRFGLREPLVAIDDFINDHFQTYHVIHIVLKGKDGWYFFLGEDGVSNLADFFKTNLLDESTLSRIESNVRETADWCAEHGIKVLYLIAPNNHSIYGEFYPVERPDGITRADQISAAITKEGVDCLFPRDLLLSKKSAAPFRLYYQLNEHWNELGAYYVYEVLREKIKAFFPDSSFPEISYRIDIKTGMFDDGKFAFLPMNEKNHVSVTPDGAEFSDFYEYIKNEGRDGVHTRNTNSTLPRALVFRDSFFIALEPFVSPLFSEVEYVWKDFTDADKERILEYKPDIVIFEHVERYASNLGLVR